MRLTQPSWRDAAPWIGLALLCLFLFAYRLGGNGLFDLDEGLYAEAAREMRVTGDFVTPRVNGEKFFEKPPLVYWLGAAGIAAFGRNANAVRLPSALSTIALVFLIAAFGGRILNRRAAFLAATAFALSPIVFGEARQLTTDATLNLFFTGALFCFWLALQSGSRRWALAFWAACGLATMAKGAPGLFPPIIGGLYLLVSHRFRLRDAIQAGRPVLTPLGPLLYLAIVLPWHIAAYRANGSEFVQEWIVRQHLQRFGGGDTSHAAPFWFYLPGLLLGMFSWSFFLPAAIAFAKRNLPNPLVSFLLTWAAFVFVFFSASGSKLISYILPMYAPAALIIGAWLDAALNRERPRALAWSAGVAWLLATPVFVAVLMHRQIIHAVEAATHKPVSLGGVTPELILFVELLAGSAAIGAGLCALCAGLGRARAAVGTLTAASIALIGCGILVGLPAVDAAFLAPLHELAAHGSAAAHVPGSRLLIYTSPRRPSALFYAEDDHFVHDGEPVLEPKTPAEVTQLAQKSSVVILTDRKHEADLSGLAGLRPLERRGEWALLVTGLPAPGVQ